jgi:sporulation-control protein spo0M
LVISAITVIVFFLLPISEAAFCNLVLSLPSMMTLHPSEDSLFEIAFPTPPPAPVTIATLPFIM